MSQGVNPPGRQSSVTSLKMSQFVGGKVKELGFSGSGS